MNRTRRFNASFVCLLLACLLGGATLAQSGRHQAPPQREAPVPTPTPEPPRVKPAPPPQTQVLVVTSTSATMQLSAYDADLVANTFLQRLRASDSLSVQTANRMGRDAAHKRAKTETERIVVWLELQVDAMANNVGLNPNIQDLHIQYALYQPGTGQTMAQGTVYLRPLSSVPIGGRRDTACYPTSFYGLDAALTIGALETAERVFNALSIPSPPLCP